MSKIRVHQVGDMRWESFRERIPLAEQGEYTDLELDSRVTIHEPGTERALQLVEVDYQPNTEIAIHAHDSDEIMYVVKGSMLVGKRVMNEGSSVFVAGNTLYSFKAGPEGLKVVNFRPVADYTFVRQAEFMRRRAEASHPKRNGPAG